MDPFNGRKTGLFGAVWIEDRDPVWAKLLGGGKIKEKGTLRGEVTGLVIGIGIRK